ncbi:MAG: TIR domain-containing protein [Candidatus Didemnitutus sp.]|nr:TIR domain-containing protein [Candidatus Didemnitutus sp.]
MSDPTKAVFLSYAHEDAAAATRIAEALRGFGVEVWFDQHELRGGDSWDGKIRQQIRDCALFLPVISANTQSRSEGYFRREWRLAVDRTHDMAEGRAFLVPVLIDDTDEYAALVPEDFRRVQWTKLVDGRPTPEFVAQVRRLLAAPVVAAPVKRAPSARAPQESTPPAQQLREAGMRVWVWPLAAVVLAVAGYFWWQSTRPAKPAIAAPSTTNIPARPELVERATSSDKSIAVLPFANLSADKENEFFADGMHDDLITALAKIRDLKVISRTSMMPYKTGARNLRKIAEELGVATILEGSVQRAGNRVRINMQLIDARTDAHLWAETYNKELTDVFSIQAALTQEISTALKASLTNDERALIARRPTENQAAYDLYLRARILDQNLQVFSPREEYERVSALYEQAAEMDPSFALAHVQASISHGQMYWFAALDPTPERRARALASLEKARALAPGSPEVRLAQGAFEYSCNNNWRGALAEYRAAERGLPNDTQLQYRIALAHRRVGEYHEALARLQRCEALNPNDSRGIVTLIETTMGLRRYPQGVALIDRYRGMLAGDGSTSLWRINAAYELDGDLPAYRRGLAALPPLQADRLGLNAAYQFALGMGDLAEADRLLQDPRWETVPGVGGVVNEPVALHRAELAWLLDRRGEATRWADEAIAYYRSRSWNARQQPVVQLDIARAQALAGRTEEAVREGRAALAAQMAFDSFNQSNLRSPLGKVLIVAGRPEEALALLREIIAEFSSITPGSIRRDPFWSRLKDDPRFEEILKSAKPL